MANIKTAISIQQPLFEKVEALARDLQVPRSRVFVLAIEDFIRRQENQHLLAKLNEVYQDGLTDEEQEQLRQTRAAHRRAVEGEW